MAMLLNLMIFLPCAGALACLACPQKAQARCVALLTTLLVAFMSILVWRSYDASTGGVQFVTAVPWISGINVWYRTGIDGVSLPLVLLTTLLSILVVLAAWNIEKATQGFMALYLLLLSGMLGVFLSLDLFLFYVFFELSLLPMYFLIGIWGGPRREYAAIKFFIYTLAGSICLLVVMLGLYHFTQGVPGTVGPVWTMVEGAWKGDEPAISLQSKAVQAIFGQGGPHWGFARWAFWLTLIAFMIKLPAVPFHTWLPDAHVEAPTPISMVLAGVLLKMGGYAMMRVTWPIFPEAAALFWYPVGALGVFAIIYGALCAMAQTDWKKLVAYSSVSHMGYVTLGIAAMTRTGWDGAYYQMIGHGIVSPMMFFMVGVVYERAHHREINRFGGLWLRWPRYGAWSLICFFAGLGLPGMAGFIGEVMALLGAFDAAGSEALIKATGLTAAAHRSQVYALGSLAAFGVVLTAGYILWMFQRVYMGKDKPEYDEYAPPSQLEYGIMTTLGIASIVFGIVPWLVFGLTDQTFSKLAASLGLAM